MKKLVSLISFCAALAATTSVSAISYNDYDILPGDGLVITAGNQYSEWFDITTSDGGLLDNVGYNPGTEQIVSATARFILGALGFQNRYFDIDLAGSDFVSGSFATFIVGGADETEPVTGLALLALDANGALQYTVTNTGNQYFTLVAAKLWVTAEDRPVQTPDASSTLMLLGLGTLALVGFRRRAAR